MVPSLDRLESRQLLSAAPVHFHTGPLRHHHAAIVEKARHAHHATARISAAAAPLAAVQGLQVVPSPQFAGGLLATVAIADNDIWAVGFNAQVPPPPAPFVPTLAEHFNGTSWSVVPTPPLPSGGVNGPGGEFLGVAAAASNDV
jgi:hypothetical protein